MKLGVSVRPFDRARLMRRAEAMVQAAAARVSGGRQIANTGNTGGAVNGERELGTATGDADSADKR